MLCVVRKRALGEAERERVRRGCCCTVAVWALASGEAERERVRIEDLRLGAPALRLAASSCSSRSSKDGNLATSSRSPCMCPERRGNRPGRQVTLRGARPSPKALTTAQKELCRSGSGGPPGLV